MAVRVLVAYATCYGSTAEVARAVAEVLAEEGALVDVQTVDAARELSAYDALVLGSAARMGRLLPEAVAFVRKNARALAGLRVAYFCVGLTMRMDTASNRRQAESYLRPLCKLVPPVGVGLFAGKVDRSKLGPLLRLFLSHDKSDTLPEGDFRDWPEIRRWARSLAKDLSAGIV